jgi:hypothetical protein
VFARPSRKTYVKKIRPMICRASERIAARDPLMTNIA